MPLLLVSYVPSDKFCLTIDKEGEGLETHHVTTIICLPVVTSDSFDIVHVMAAELRCTVSMIASKKWSFGCRALS